MRRLASTSAMAMESAKKPNATASQAGVDQNVPPKAALSVLMASATPTT